jgi:hypothetical protein
MTTFFRREDIDFLRIHAEQGERGLMCRSNGKPINYALIEQTILPSSKSDTGSRLVNVMYPWCTVCTRKSDVPSSQKLKDVIINESDLVKVG